MSKHIIKDTISASDAIGWGACYKDDQVRETLPTPEPTLSLIRRADIPAEDRLWCVLREEVLDTWSLRMFAADCAERAMLMAGWNHPSSVRAVEHAREIANGAEPDTKIWDAPGYAAAAAARAAARAARNAAGAAAGGDFAWSAAGEAAGAAGNASWSAECVWQIRRLDWLLTGDGDEPRIDEGLNQKGGDA